MNGDGTILPTSCGRCGKAATPAHHYTRAGAVDDLADAHHRPAPTGRRVPWPVRPVPLDPTCPEAINAAAAGG